MSESAVRLHSALHGTAGLFRAGEISLQHALAIHDETAACGIELCAAVEELVLGKASEQTHGEFRRSVKKRSPRWIRTGSPPGTKKRSRRNPTWGSRTAPTG